MMTPLVIYFVLCLMVAYMGRRTRVGFYRSLLFSIIMTPMVMIVYLLIFESVEPRRLRKDWDSENQR